MADYDAIFKVMLSQSARQLQLAVGKRRVVEWLNIELPQARTPRVDLLGKSGSGELLHLEIQSTNDPDMALRMGEYALGIYRIHRTMPYQVVFYVGNAALNMGTELRGKQSLIAYELVDARSLEVAPLLDSPDLDDNLVALLGRLRQDEGRGMVRLLLRRIAALPPDEREEAYSRLLLLAGLRRMEEVVDEERHAMGMIFDLRENKVLGPPYLRGLAEGEARGEVRGEARGKIEGKIDLLQRQLSRRFGPLPTWVGEALRGKTEAEIEDLGCRMLDAQDLHDLLGNRRN